MVKTLLQLFRKYASYFWDVELAKASTPFNPELTLSLRQGRYYLSTPNAVYSHGDLYTVFFSAFSKIDFTKLRINEVLILGFGMGSIPFMLQENFDQDYNYTGVEADSVIIHWAESYLPPSLMSKIELRNTDAFQYVKDCDKKFGLICVDVFIDETIPEQLLNRAFTEHLSELLTDGGLIMWNHLSDKESNCQETQDFFKNIFNKCFPDAVVVDLGANSMLFSNPAMWKSYKSNK